jgi:hypothetical protein
MYDLTMDENPQPDLAALAERFADPREFGSPPLYRALSQTVAEHPRLLRLAARGRPGQHPSFLFFGAVQALLLAGAEHALARHPLARFYPSVVGADAALPGEAGPALVDFCFQHEAELGTLIEARLVQTNLVRRALALRLGLAAIARSTSRPVHLIEVGASAGALLRFDRYGYALGGRTFGDQSSPVQITSEWRVADPMTTPVPDLDALPPTASATGIDLNPLDATNPSDRRWLEALVWPENRSEADLLHQALAIVAADPPPILAGDAVDACPALAATLPPGEPRVVFHAMTRLHVPAERLATFDAAIEALGQTGPLWWLSLEGPGALDLRGPDGTLRHVARCGARIEWIEPLE